MQMIAGQNVRPNSRPGPIGFGFGSGHNPTAAATMMNRSGPAPTTSKARPTFTHTDLRYWRIAKCGLTVKVSGRAMPPDKRRGRTLTSSARGAKQTTLHGPLQRLLGGNLLEGELRSVGTNRGVLNRDVADVGLGVEVHDGVLV